MKTAICFQIAEDNSVVQWVPQDNPPFLVNRSGMLVVELPMGEDEPPRVFVDGMVVVARTHLVPLGALVRIVWPDGRTIAYKVHRPVIDHQVEPGNGRPCGFTGLPIKGEAVRCPGAGCGLLLASEVVTQVERCPRCNTSLQTRPTPEEMPGEEEL
ncbi:MAG: hypothetical protein JXB46_03745 [Candidatus Eisenbacteria bacterium]|nr:hypothetical protein [Candidatus Eisenbacteria bacterium]